jgi:uncharacterized membrane protein (DUF4010 family)
MKNFNPKESTTWAGIAIILTNVAGTLAAAGLVKPAAVVAALGALMGAVAGYIPDNKTTVIK